MWMSGSRSIAAVTASANFSRSTASAWPAGTAVSRAISISSEPARRISSFSSQGAVFSVSDFSELEHTNSAKFAVWWAGVERTGRISNSSTATPRRAHCQAASEPASPAPMMRMGLGMNVSAAKSYLLFQNHETRERLLNWVVRGFNRIRSAPSAGWWGDFGLLQKYPPT